MHLSLAEAASALGRSERQVRYLIKTGRLKATKDGGRWVVDRADLPLSVGQRQARQKKAESLQDAVEQALGPHLDPLARKTWTVRSMGSFRSAHAAWKLAHEAVGLEHPAVAALQQTLLEIGRGCHAFHPEDKKAAFRMAREHASDAAVLLILEGSEKAISAANAVERDVLPALAGLARRQEKGQRP